MHTIGIVACKKERLEKCSRLNLLKWRSPDFYDCPEAGIRFVVAYEQQNVRRIFQREQVSVVLKSRQCRYSKLQEFHLATGEQAYMDNIPFVIKKILKVKHSADQNETVAIIDDVLSQETVDFVERLQGFVRYITVVTKNLDKAEQLAEEMMERHGIAIHVSDGSVPVQCQIAVNLDGWECNLPKNTIILARFGAHNIENRKHVINNLAITGRFQLPLDISYLALLDAMEALGLKKFDFKITAFLFDDRQINIFDNL